MSAIFRLFTGLLLSALAFSTLAGGATLLRNIESVFKSGSYVKVARIAELTANDLRHSSMVDNINGLLGLAEQEQRIDAIQMMQLSRQFTKVAEGDQILLACLKHPQCQPDTFFEVMNTSKLHAEVVTRNPSLGRISANHAVGALNENLMVRYFEHSGWTRVEGQVGRSGFDGLFVKYQGGIIKDVLIAESKYNTSSLQSTNHGIQMSEDWVRRKMVELKARFPGKLLYDDIDQFIQAGVYRAVLWNLRVDDTSINISLNKLRSKGSTVEIADAIHLDLSPLPLESSNRITLQAPRNRFEERFLGWYNDELAAVGRTIH